MVFSLRSALLCAAPFGVVGQYPCAGPIEGWTITNGAAKTNDPSCAGDLSTSCTFDDCCSGSADYDVPDCSSHTCTAGTTLKSNAADIPYIVPSTCSFSAFGLSCGDFVCCDTVDDTCLDQFVQAGVLCNPINILSGGMGKFVDINKYGNTASTNDEIVENCCTPYADALCENWYLLGTCEDDTKYVDLTKGKTSCEAITDFSDTCCTVRSTCSSYSCPDGYEYVDSPGTVSCSSDAASCNTATCCQMKANTCLHKYATNKTWTCADGQVDANAATVVTDGTEATACCADKFKCSAFEAGSDVSFASRMQGWVAATVAALAAAASNL